MPSLHYAPLTAAALNEFYEDRQAETEDTCTYKQDKIKLEQEDV